MDPEAQIVGADAWRRLSYEWLACGSKAGRDSLARVADAMQLHDVQELVVEGALEHLARRVARWSDLRRELYLGVLRRRVEGR